MPFQDVNLAEDEATYQFILAANQEKARKKAEYEANKTSFTNVKPVYFTPQDNVEYTLRILPPTHPNRKWYEKFSQYFKIGGSPKPFKDFDSYTLAQKLEAGKRDFFPKKFKAEGEDGKEKWLPYIYEEELIANVLDNFFNLNEEGKWNPEIVKTLQFENRESTTAKGLRGLAEYVTAHNPINKVIELAKADGVPFDVLKEYLPTVQYTVNAVDRTVLNDFDLFIAKSGITISSATQAEELMLKFQEDRKVVIMPQIVNFYRAVGEQLLSWQVKPGYAGFNNPISGLDVLYTKQKSTKTTYVLMPAMGYRPIHPNPFVVEVLAKYAVDLAIITRPPSLAFLNNEIQSYANQIYATIKTKTATPISQAVQTPVNIFKPTPAFTPAAPAAFVGYPAVPLSTVTGSSTSALVEGVVTGAVEPVHSFYTPTPIDVPQPTPLSSPLSSPVASAAKVEVPVTPLPSNNFIFANQVTATGKLIPECYGSSTVFNKISMKCLQCFANKQCESELKYAHGEFAKK